MLHDLTNRKLLDLTSIRPNNVMELFEVGETGFETREAGLGRKNLGFCGNELVILGVLRPTLALPLSS